MSTCIIVVGSYRCGTSAVAGMLHKLGVHMGDKFDPPNPNNPRGFWEDVEFKDLHKDMLEGEPRWGHYRNIIRLRESEYKIWGIKDPRLCILLPMVISELNTMGIDHKVITCLRNPHDIAASLSKSVDDDKVDWLSYVTEHISNKTKNLGEYEGDIMSLTFDSIFSPNTLDRIAKFVGKDVTTEAQSWIGPSVLGYDGEE